MGRTSDARARLINAANDLIWAYSYGAITIDAICERASVKKGSFYYFFESKSELAVVAITAWWAERHTVLEKLFRRELPPLARLREYLDFASHRQLTAFEENGQVLGCPVYGLGAEISTQDEELRLLVVGILLRITAYVEEAIREAQDLGQISAGDPAQKAARLLRYYAGMLTQARIENDPEPIRQLTSDGLDLIGANRAAGAPAFATARVITPATPPAALATSR
jgi:TetR/AcrR family transcriptional repressor of nem operon